MFWCEVELRVSGAVVCPLRVAEFRVREQLANDYLRSLPL